MAKWLIWLVTGAVLAAIGIVMMVVGLDTADKIGSVIGALGGLVGIALSGYSIIAARREKCMPAINQSVNNSKIGGSNVQIGSVEGDVEIDG